MVERYKYKCIDAYEEPENPMEWLPCPRCGLLPLVWEFDNGRDAEVSGFITSWLSFGNRKAIIGAAERMDREFGGSPYGWLMDRQYVKVYNYLTRYGREEDKNVPKKRQVY